MKNTTIPFFLLASLLFGCSQKEENPALPPSLTQKEFSIIKIAVCTALGDLETLQSEFNTALDEGMSLNEVKEVLIQLYAYCGFPRSLQSINTLMRVVDERKSRGIEDAAGPEPQAVAAEGKYEIGRATLERLTGQPQQTISGANAFAPGIDVFLKEHLFADIFGRGILSEKERELATFSALSSLDFIDPQRAAHRAIAARRGVSEEALNFVSATAASIRSRFEKNNGSAR